jgi:hypothetical protein
MANYYISMLVPVLQQHGHAFLKMKFQERKEFGLVDINSIQCWLAAVLIPDTKWIETQQALLEAEYWTPADDMMNVTSILQQTASNTEANNESTETILPSLLDPRHTQGIVAVAFCQLLQSLQRWNSSDATSSLIPETLHWDKQRLAEMKDLIDIIAIESTIVMLSRKILMFYKVPTRESEEIELQHRLDVLLRDILFESKDSTADNNSSTEIASSTETSSSSSYISFENIEQEIVSYLQFAIFRNREGSSPSQSLIQYHGTLSSSSSLASSAAIGSSATYDLKDLHDRVHRMLVELFPSTSFHHSPHPILQLYTQRIYKLLLRAMLQISYTSKLTTYSLQSKAQERNLARLMDIGVKLLKHTMAIHQTMYGEIIGNVLKNK